MDRASVSLNICDSAVKHVFVVLSVGLDGDQGKLGASARVHSGSSELYEPITTAMTTYSGPLSLVIGQECGGGISMGR